jgi:hypothetical protein
VIGDLLVRYQGNWNIAFYMSSGVFLVGAVCWIFIDPVTSMDDSQHRTPLPQAT